MGSTRGPIESLINTVKLNIDVYPILTASRGLVSSPATEFINLTTLENSVFFAG